MAGVFVTLLLLGGICGSIAVFWVSGWPVIAKDFPSEPEYRGKWFRSPTTTLGFVRMGPWIKMGCSTEGLHLELSFPVRLFFRSVFIPWEDIAVESGTVFCWLVPACHFCFGGRYSRLKVSRGTVRLMVAYMREEFGQRPPCLSGMSE